MASNAARHGLQRANGGRTWSSIPQTVLERIPLLAKDRVDLLLRKQKVSPTSAVLLVGYIRDCLFMSGIRTKASRNSRPSGVYTARAGLAVRMTLAVGGCESSAHRPTICNGPPCALFKHYAQAGESKLAHLRVISFIFRVSATCRG